MLTLYDKLPEESALGGTFPRMLDLETEKKSAWTEFLELAEQKCSQTEFQNWFSPIKMIEETLEGITLEVPNIFVREYLLDNYKEILLDFLPANANGDPAVEFVIKDAPKKPVSSPISLPKVENNSLFNPHYTFENYIEGPSNQFVKSAAVGVAAKPGKSFNPLFIHGGVGLGKTHLLHGIGHYVTKHHKRLKVKCITTEAFINDLVDNLRNKSVDKMKRFYRSLDLLLVDDIQFLQSRLNFEEEFCNTFESLINQSKQIVITSDKPPSELKLSERMIARMEWGLVANVVAPDLETRVAILQYKAAARGLHISNDVAFFIAEHIYNNVRQIEGAINRLSAYSHLMDIDLSIAMVEKILSSLFQKSADKKISVENILKNVSTVFDVKISDIRGESRLKNIAHARQVAMYLAKELVTESLMKIAANFGGKTHSTLLHAWKKIKTQLDKDEMLEKQIEMVKRHLGY